MRISIYYKVVCQDFSKYNYKDGKLSKLSSEKRYRFAFYLNYRTRTLGQLPFSRRIGQISLSRKCRLQNFIEPISKIVDHAQEQGTD